MASYNIGMQFPLKFADAGLHVDKEGRYVSADSFEFRVASGQVPGYSLITASGHNNNVAQAYVPVVDGGEWQTPQVADAIQLRLAAGGDVADTAAGVGAQEVTFIGMDPTGASITEALATNGALASLNTTQFFLRLLSAAVTKSGTYSTFTADSHAAAIVIEDSAGVNQWSTIPFSGTLAHSRSKIGCVTVPRDKFGWITRIGLGIDSTRSTDVALFQRDNILETAPPYSPFQIVQELVGAGGINQFDGKFPLGPFSELTDLGVMAKVAQTTATVSSSISMIVVDKTLI